MCFWCILMLEWYWLKRWEFWGIRIWFLENVGIGLEMIVIMEFGRLLLMVV